VTDARDEVPDNTVILEVDGPVATITLNRPDKLNALTAPMQSDYIDALDAADADPAVRAVVVTGAGRGFCAGADVAALEAGSTALRQFVPTTAVLPAHALSIRKPVIAAVNGPVAGIGFAVMVCTDVRLASSTAQMSTTFSSLGLVAEYGLSWLLPRMVGLPNAIDLLFSARTVDAAEALAMGLVAEVCEPDRLLAEARRVALGFAERSPWSLAMMKQQIYADLHRPLGDAMEHSLEAMRQSFDRPDLGEAITARAGRRPPVFPPLP